MSFSAKINYLIALAILLIVASFVVWREDITRLVLNDDSDVAEDLIRFSPPIPEIKAHDWDEVGVYENPVYRYRVEYPATNFRIDPDVSTKDPTNVGFWPAPGLDDSRTLIFNARATSARELREMLARYTRDGQFVFERNITVDAVPAAVVHWAENGREYPEAKVAFFIKDGYEYEIWTEYVDHERVWNSFRFVE